MAVSQAQKLAIAKYRQEKRDQLSIDVPKGKRDEYKTRAAELGMSLSALIQRGVESYGTDGGEVPRVDDKLTGEQRRLLEEFGKLPVDVRRKLVALIRAVNTPSGVESD